MADPSTGEIMSTAGESVTAELAEKIGRAGVNVVYLDVEGKKVKVFSNGMVNIHDFVDFNIDELEIDELVRLIF